MIWYDAEFWMRYYRWAIRTPVDREIARLGHSVQMVQLTLVDNFTPVARRAAWAFEDFNFALSPADKPRWPWPLLRLLHRIGTARRLIALD